MRNICRIVLLAFCSVPLAGCLTDSVGSVKGGECKVFEAPKYAVLGKTPYDQDVVDNFVESGVGGCRWKRPAPRPASLDAPAGQVTPAVAKKKHGFIRRIKDKVEKVESDWSSKPSKPIMPTPEPPAAIPGPAATEVAAPPPKPRSRLDELLHPNGD